MIPFSIWVMGGIQGPLMGYGSGKLPMGERVNSSVEDPFWPNSDPGHCTSNDGLELE